MNIDDSSNVLGKMDTSKAIVKIAIPATLALLAKAIYNIVDTAFIGMLNSDIALTAVGVTLPILLIMVSVENIFASGAAVIAGRQIGAGDDKKASETVSTVIGISIIVGIILCVLGIIFIDPILRLFGSSDAALPQAKEYAFWMFIAALFNLPAQSMNSAARAESSARISSIAIITGALLNVFLDPIFMFSWGFNLGVGGASLATTLSQFVTFAILLVFYASGKSVIKVSIKSFKPSWNFIRVTTAIGIPTAVIQICLSVASSLTNMASATLNNSDEIIAAYGVVQRLVLIGSYIIMGFMQGYQPVASYAFGAKNEERFLSSVHFARKGTIFLSLLVTIISIVFSKPLILAFNRNPMIIKYGILLLFSQTILFVAFGLCYMMTITFQTIGEAKFGLLLSTIRQGIFFIPVILILPKLFGFKGVFLSQIVADILSLTFCIMSIPKMKKIASARMNEKK